MLAQVRLSYAYPAINDNLQSNAYERNWAYDAILGQVRYPIKAIHDNVLQVSLQWCGKDAALLTNNMKCEAQPCKQI